MSEPERIAQILNKMGSGGIEAVVSGYFRHIDKSRYLFDFYYSGESNIPCREELESMGAVFYPMPGLKNPLKYQRVLYKKLKANKYKIVHVHMNTLSVLALIPAWLAKIPVRICHNHSTASRKEKGRTMVKYLLRPLNRIFATDYYACGELAGRWMFGKNAFDRGLVAVLPNSIEIKRFAYDEQARRRLREELKIPQDAFVLGHIGRFMKQKNHEFLIEIFAELLKISQNARLLLVGEGRLKRDIQQKVFDMGISDRVIFTGARADADKLYSAMDAFCLPSLYEGMPVVAVEAQANGLPVICADTVSAEAELTPLVQRLPLSDAGKWAETVLKSKRSADVELPECFNIKNAADILAEKYAELSAGT